MQCEKTIGLKEVVISVYKAELESEEGPRIVPNTVLFDTHIRLVPRYRWRH